MMTDHEAQIIALNALGWLAEQPDDMQAFLSQAGLEASELSSLASEGPFLAGLMAFLTSSDERILGAAAAQGIAPERFARAGVVLNGELRHWT